MTTYLDVAAVRIQHYLSRTRRLSGTRGASAMIRRATSRYEYQSLATAEDSHSEVTSWETVDPVDLICSKLTETSKGWERNRQAGDIDGVVSLQHNRNLTPHEIEQVFAAVVQILRLGPSPSKADSQSPKISVLPGVELHGKWATLEHDASYVETYPSMQSNTLYSAPAALDYPALQPCAICGTAPEVAIVVRPATTLELPACADCYQRENRPGRSQGIHEAYVADQLHYGVEADLLKAVMPEGEPSYVDDFKNLSALGKQTSVGTQRRSNHLATIMIDGDAIGAQFEKALASPGIDEYWKSEAVARLADATKSALVTATQALRANMKNGGNGYPCPVIPHVCGGDDLLVSVPANQAWRFTHAFLIDFEKRTRDLIPNAKITASASIIFAKHQSPFAESVESADQLLGQTKITAAVRRHADPAARSMIGWRDLTQDGPDSTHEVIDLADWDATSERMNDLNEIEENGLMVMRRVITDMDENRTRPDHVLSRLNRDQQRLRQGTTTRTLVRVSEADDYRAALEELRDDIDRRRWW